MKKNKTWITSILTLILMSISTIASINYYMDPMWTFNHEHKFSDYQRARKERQQKSNALYFRDKKYDTLIFGSSRVTYMNQHTWNENTFNYSVSDMQPNEYHEYLNFAIQEAKQPIKEVIIGLDFFGALTYSPLIANESKSILDTITTPLYRYKLLLSIDSLDYSFKNIKYTFTKPSAKYNYNYVKNTKMKTDININTFNENIQTDLKLYTRDRYTKSYDENYKNILSHLVSLHPNIKFTVFTTPVSQKHFEEILPQNLYNNYERWLQESVEIFHEVHHFMYINELSKNAHIYFQDSNHGYSTTYDCLSNELLSRQSLCPKIDMLLNKDNIQKKLNYLREKNNFID